METWDYVIIGAGSAGCVLANRLTEDGDLRVLLLEAGGEDWSPFIRIPAALLRLSAKYNWRYPAEPDPTRKGIVDHWAAGRVIGGSSSINGMLWARGHRRDYDYWTSLGCDGWDYESVLPYFKRAETYEFGEDEYRGSNGPQYVSQVRCPHPLTDVFIAAAKQTGYKFQPDYNGEDQEGVSNAQVSQKLGQRHSTARAYLALARRRPNLTLRKNSLVTRIIIEDERSVGVEYRQGEGNFQVRCGREVILSAGAIASPKLLMLSGIGPAEHLHEHGITVLMDNPGVGNNLQEHPSALMIYRVNMRTFNQEFTVRGVLRHGVDFLLRRRGAVSSPIAHAVIFASLASGEYEARNPWTDFEIIFSPFGMTYSADKAPTVANNDPKSYSHDVQAIGLMRDGAVTAFPSLLHPLARGSIRLRSSSPDDPPIIHHHLLGEEDDVVALIKACRKTREIFGADQFKHHLVGEHLPGEHVQSDDDWKEFLSTYSFRTEHPIGTCKIGTDALSVVDPSLRVRGIKGLRVIDASVMPTLPSGNTNAPTILIAEKGADLIRSQGNES